jgi:hypothetical protein
MSKIYAEEIASKELKPLRPGEQFTVPPAAAMYLSSEPIFLSLMQGVPNDGTAVNKKLAIEFAPGEILIKTNVGNVVVLKLEVDINVSFKAMTTAPTKVLEYRSDEKAIIQLADTELIIDERKNLKVIISQHRLMS